MVLPKLQKQKQLIFCFVGLFAAFCLVISGCSQQPASESTSNKSAQEMNGKTTGNIAEKGLTENSKPLAGVPENAPDIEFKQLKHEFGKVFEGQEVSTSFVFYNRGKETLMIEKVKAG